MTASGDFLAFRSAVEGAYLSAPHLRAELPAENLPPPDALEAGFNRYPSGSRELQLWLVWRRLILLERAYIAWRAELEAGTALFIPAIAPEDKAALEAFFKERATPPVLIMTNEAAAAADEAAPPNPAGEAGSDLTSGGSHGLD